jgi:hypothetical protein
MPFLSEGVLVSVGCMTDHSPAGTVPTRVLLYDIQAYSPGRETTV